MKEIKFKQMTNAGELNGVLRILGKILYFKFNNSTYATQMIETMKQKGAIIEFSKKLDWIRVDIFKDNDFIKLGEKEIDLKESTDEEIESFIADFYMEQYQKMKFKAELI